MKFPAKVEYGLKAAANLGKAFPAQKSIKELAKEEAIPFKFLEGIMNQLRKSRLVVSQRGINGGYKLKENPSKVEVLALIKALDNTSLFLKCEKSNCPSQNTCASNVLWIKLENEFVKTLKKIKLSDLIKNYGK